MTQQFYYCCTHTLKWNHSVNGWQRVGARVLSSEWGFTDKEVVQARVIDPPHQGRGSVPSRPKGAGRAHKWHVRGRPANNTASLPPVHSCHTPVLLSLSLAQLVAQETHRLPTCQESRSIYLRTQALAVTFTHFSYCNCQKGLGPASCHHLLSDSRGSSLLQP